MKPTKKQISQLSQTAQVLYALADIDLVEVMCEEEFKEYLLKAQDSLNAVVEDICDEDDEKRSKGV